MKIFKFGGASIKDANGIRHLSGILKQNLSEPPQVVVVSAMGKTTNALEEVMQDYFEQRATAQDKLREIKERHLRIAAELDLPGILNEGTLSDIFVEAEWLIEDEVRDPYDYLYDQIVAIGELLSTRLVHAYLRSQGMPVAWVDARDVIKTDDTYRNGKLDWERTAQKISQFLHPHLETQEIVVIAGFIGSTPENNTITLGREGSDYTGALLASLLGAESLTVWKDVPGIMTADPHLFPDAELLPRIDYQEAIEMTFYGAKVLHPKTMKPLMEKGIPLYVRSFENPELPGTVVRDFPSLTYPPIKVVLEDQTLLQMSTLDHTFIFEDHLSAVFRLATEHRIRVQMMENLALNLSLVVQADQTHLEEFKKALQNDFVIRQVDHLQLFTIRHFNLPIVESIKTGRKVYIEEYNASTAQLLIGEDL